MNFRKLVPTFAKRSLILEQYPDSGEDILENMTRYAEKWGVTLDPISRHEDRISDMTETESEYSHCIR